MCQDRQPAGTDLIGGISVFRHPVAADKDDVDHAGFQQDRGHVVTLHGCRYAGIIQFKGCQTGSLQERSGLIAVYMHIFRCPSVLQRHIHGGCRRAVLGCCQRTGIAVRQDPDFLAGLLQLLKQAESDLTDIPADLHIFFTDRICFAEQDLLDLGDRFFLICLCRGVDPVQCPEQIDGGRTGRCQILFLSKECFIESVKRLLFYIGCQQGKPVRRTDTDGRRPSHLQPLDGIPDLFPGTQLDPLDRSRKKRLIQNINIGIILRDLDRDHLFKKIIQRRHLYLLFLPLTFTT